VFLHRHYELQIAISVTNMIFNSLTFLIFFFIFFHLYWLINNKLPIGYRNLFTIFSSYLFYGWWDWRFLGLIVASSAIDFTIGLLLAKEKREKRRKLLLLISIAANLGILGFFKYFNFFIDSLIGAASLFSITLNVTTLKIILPVGISFYTFQTLSYTIDVYKKRLSPTKDILSFFAFVSFFPQLVAVPIERAGHLLKQFQERKNFSYNNMVIGLRLALWGFFKKVVVADNFGVLTNHIFNGDYGSSGILTIAGALFFAFQIYADFSGYSDIAIGLSKMLGFDLMKNFSTPYFSSSFGEFWHRWHISLSTWFRDYLYIPLGGNRGSQVRVSFNLFVTFLLSGLWHGANSTFLIWGGLHGLLLIIEKKIKGKVNKYIYTPFVLLCLVLLWIPFRAKNFDQFINLSKSLVDFGSYSLAGLSRITNDFPLSRFLGLMLVTVFFLFVEYQLKLKDFNEWIREKSKNTRLTYYYIVLLLILVIGNFSVKPYFIYFQF